MAQLLKNLPAMQETWVRSLGWEDPLEKGMATLSSILAWRIPWTEKPGKGEPPEYLFSEGGYMHLRFGRKGEPLPYNYDCCSGNRSTDGA